MLSLDDEDKEDKPPPSPHTRTSPPPTTTKKPSLSSARWLARQAHDPYILKRNQLGLRSRSAFKLEEMDDKLGGFLKRAARIVDLGAAPGGWSQICRRRSPHARVVGVDLIPIEALDAKTTFLTGDFTEPEVQARIAREFEDRPVDLVLSDMAPNTTGDPHADHWRCMRLCEQALAFALKHQARAFLCKVFLGSDSTAFFQQVRQAFPQQARWLKPSASRKDSREVYVYAAAVHHG